MMQPELKIWRPAVRNGPICMQGFTTGYSIDPVGEFVVGIIDSGRMVGRRGRSRTLFDPGDLCFWDPSGNHSGAPAVDVGWHARLIMFDLPTFDELSVDPDAAPQIRTVPDKRVVDRTLARQFVRMHETLRAAESALEAEVALLDFFQALSGGLPDKWSRRSLHQTALRRACELLADAPERNVSLVELSDVAGVSRHQLTRMFRRAFGVAPHRYQLAQRLRRARHLLERENSLAQVAQKSGFFDQSHMHRHFLRATGMPPSQYARLIRSNIQDRMTSPS